MMTATETTQCHSHVRSQSEDACELQHLKASEESMAIGQSLTSASPRSSIRQLNGCNDNEMEDFFREVFGQEEAGTTLLNPLVDPPVVPHRSSLGHRRHLSNEICEVCLADMVQELHDEDMPSNPLLVESLPKEVSKSPSDEDIGLCRTRSGTLDTQTSTPYASPLSAKVVTLKDRQTTGTKQNERSPQPPALPLDRSDVKSLDLPDLVSPDGASSMNDRSEERDYLQRMGDHSERQGKLEEALDFYDLCYELDEELGELISMDESATVHLKIGIVYWKLSLYDDSLQHLRFAVSIYEGALGPTWLQQADMFSNITVFVSSEIFLMLGRVHLSLGDSKEARCHVKESLTILSTSRVEHDVALPMFAKGLHSLGMTYEVCGSTTTALRYYQEAFIMQQQSYGDDHVDVAASLASIGSLHEKFGSFDKAMKFFVDALSIYESQVGEDSCQVNIGSILSRIGWICFLQDHNESAMEAYAESIDNFTALLGARHRNVASVRVQMAMVLQRTGRLEEALSTYKSAMGIQRQALGQVHGDIAITLDGMASICDSLGKTKMAISCLDEALHIRRQVVGKRHVDVAQTFCSLGDMYAKTKCSSLAKQCYRNALKVFKANNISDCDKRLLVVTRALHKLTRPHTF